MALNNLVGSSATGASASGAPTVLRSITGSSAGSTTVAAAFSVVLNLVGTSAGVATAVALVRSSDRSPTTYRLGLFEEDPGIPPAGLADDMVLLSYAGEETALYTLDPRPLRLKIRGD